ncbi:hypothetical protein [Macrococcoides caseolyticum]|uniref:hypothetical protein n=1 Tax=Macrococcoides caseolyticum TaxID=69966 RepID=UPI0005A1B4C7|nr:hypothetical protein [Macrococcus caseolyticus]MDJ1089861.1 hypothetical protein [Macrococcus caseolyticus]PKE11116.1 hypothetical protein CW685_08435 [Macrococcus caseolyticus]PNZ73037.1 hypothetical protein CD152_06280 [Macrococcus caseolyticus]QPT47836.1 hypothetical protein I6G25_11510 [Macrococcus caseolyticus]
MRLMFFGIMMVLSILAFITIGPSGVLGILIIGVMFILLPGVVIAALRLIWLLFSGCLVWIVVFIIFIILLRIFMMF